jgi:hypothetical protein
VLNPIEKRERNTHRVVRFHAELYPGPQLKLILPAARSINSGPYVQFASVGKITDGFIEIPTALLHRFSKSHLKKLSPVGIRAHLRVPGHLVVTSSPNKALIICHFAFLDFFFRATYHPAITSPFCSTGASSNRRECTSLEVTYARPHAGICPTRRALCPGLKRSVYRCPPERRAQAARSPAQPASAT